jgi:spermidine synthase
MGALQRIFPGVMVTFGDPVMVFATGEGGVLADSGEFLARRYLARGIRSPYFDPLWFEGGSDLLDPVKRRGVRTALQEQAPRLINTDSRPAASLYYLQMWIARSVGSQRGGEQVGETEPAEERAGLVPFLLRLRFWWVAAGLVIITLLVGLPSLPRGEGGLSRRALLWSVGTTGFAGMAIEIVLLHTFQVLYGFVYGMVGLIIGVFMFGLVAGSHLMNRRLRSHSGGGPGLRGIVMLDLSIMLFAALLVPVLALLRGSAAEWPVLLIVFLLVALSGMLGGLMIPLAASVRLEQGSDTARAAGAVSASDHMGGCLGALVTGVALVPVLGTGGACFTIALMKGLSGLLSGAAARS